MGKMMRQPVMGAIRVPSDREDAAFVKETDLAVMSHQTEAFRPGLSQEQAVVGVLVLLSGAFPPELVFVHQMLREERQFDKTGDSAVFYKLRCREFQVVRFAFAFVVDFKDGNRTEIDPVPGIKNGFSRL